MGDWLAELRRLADGLETAVRQDDPKVLIRTRFTPDLHLIYTWRLQTAVRQDGARVKTSTWFAPSWDCMHSLAISRKPLEIAGRLRSPRRIARLRSPGDCGASGFAADLHLVCA